MKRYARGSHPYYQYKRKHSLNIENRKRRRWPWVVVVIPLISVLLFAGFLYSRPLPLLAPEKKVLALSAQEQPPIAWPSGSQAAFGTVEQGLLESQPNQTVRPTASTIKLLTALTVLDAKPLKVDEQGPLITLTQADMAIYNNYYAKDGSLAQIAVGEQLSERQMLEGILVSSANNYADSLAIWAFGSLEKYRVAAQAMAGKLGLKHTTVGSDASGFSPDTTSTAGDLTILGIAAIKQPVVAQIVQQPETILPIAGVKRNTNWLLGDDGVVGVKTGNTNEIGGVFVFAYNHQVDASHKVTIVGAIQGKPTIFEAVLEARAFIKQIKTYFSVATPVKKGEVVATYQAPWGQKIHAVAGEDVSFVTGPGATAKPRLNLDSIATPTASGNSVGTVAFGGASVKIITTSQLAEPTWQWRVFGR